jgi:hypothetical protein
VVIEVLRIPLAKDRLRAIPQEERALFLLLGHAANQINLLFKLVIFSTNKTPADQPEQNISGAQSQILARILIGFLAEAWELIRTQFLESPIGREYSSKLDQDGQLALTNLKNKFGRSNLFSKLRNEHIFHHPSASDMEAAFQAAVNDPQWDNDWNWFFSVYNYNSFFFLNDIVFMHGLLNAIGETDLIAAHEKIMGEVRPVSENMMTFLMALNAAFWKKHFGQEMTGEVVARIADAPGVFDVWIPFFVEIPPDDPVP